MQLPHTLDFAGPTPRSDDLAWGHASGWAQLYGECRHLSCVVLGIASRAHLAPMFDSLSDALTEAGYPWEVVAVDTGSGQGLPAWLDALRERPGFRRLTLPADAGFAVSLMRALEAARGDAVLLLQARDGRLATSIPDMVAQWSDGQEIVRSQWLMDSPDGAESGANSLPLASTPREEPSLARGLGRLLGNEAILLDRRAVSMLLESS